MLSFAGAIEPLRIANAQSGRELYAWTLAGEGGTTARCSNGTELRLDAGLDEVGRDDTILVAGGIDIQAAATRPVLNWLRREARRGVTIGGLCTASWVLARAGLLDGKRATIHWENQDSFAEEFHEIDLTKSVFVMDGRRYSTAGGTSSIDLMLKIIANDHGEELANLVADQLIYTSIRTDQDTQRLSIPTRIGVRHPKLSAVIHMMEENIEEPISRRSWPKRWGCPPAAGTAVSPLSEPLAQAILYGAATAKGAQPADADRYERDQRGAGLRLHLAIAFFQMLSGALQHHTLSRTRRPGRAAVGLGRP